MFRVARAPLAAATLSACAILADQPAAVCPLPTSSLRAPVSEGPAVIWNYLGSVPLPAGWSVSEAAGTRLELAHAASRSRLRLELSCCGAIPQAGSGTHETLSAAGRQFHIWTARQGTALRQTFRTFPFALVDLDDGAASPGQAIRPPALLTAELACTGPACAQGRAIVLGIGYDEGATRLAVNGVAGPGTAAAPLRSDGLPSGIELPAPVPGIEPRPWPNVYTPEACASE